MDPNYLYLLAAAAVTAPSVLLLMLQRARRDTARARDELARAEAQTREQIRQGTRLRNEQRTMANFVRILPAAVQDLNRDSLDARHVPRLILQLAGAIFEPEQILLYLTRAADGEPGEPKRLHLVASRGLSDAPEGIRSIRTGEGKIGWVAAHRIDMTIDDWLNPTRTEGVPPPDNLPGLRLDLMSPLLQHGRERDETLGVLCLGSPVARPRDEKLMLQMVANLGAIALIHARNLQSLRSRANHDGLTGLLNRRHFMHELALSINAAEKEAQNVGVFMFDIDHFKRFNDTNGHLAGDELLKTIAQVIRENVRPGDLAGRYGGEEFVVAMPDSDPDTSLAVAERIRAAIADHAFPHRESQPGGRLTISGGVATFPVDGTSTTDLIQHADQALYRAKAADRNRVLRHEGISIGSIELDAGDLEDPAEFRGAGLPLER